MKHIRELHKFARQLGVELLVEQGGKHLKCSVMKNGRQSLPFIVSSTPSDQNAIHGMKRDLQRAAKSLEA